ncbi:hypothetical protein predicted by Glimmer/Critica [Lactiplantibacillus plantarum]|nr:hypothetical protein predicted by Glimmer/Critica [Lactiplantibacillus plantarum]
MPSESSQSTSNIGTTGTDIPVKSLLGNDSAG